MLSRLETGYFASVSAPTTRGKVHVRERNTGRLLCGQQPKAQWHWCSMGANDRYTECVRCREKAGLT